MLLGLASPLPGRQKALNDEALLYIGKALQLPLTEGKEKADAHALYAIVLQNRGAKKRGSEKRKFYEVLPVENFLEEQKKELCNQMTTNVANFTSRPHRSILLLR